MPRTVSKSTTRTAPPSKVRGPVKRVTALKGHAPTVTRLPKGSKERKVVEQTTEVPYWERVKRQFFR